jgi:threonine/homoserine/homoserine lactone efflux protein
MTLEIWLAYVLAVGVVLVIPGPTILLVVSQAVSRGSRSVAPLAAGVVLGDLTAMTFSLLGLGAVLATSATMFSLLKWIGAIYLIYLGARMWVASPDAEALRPPGSAAPGRELFRSAFIVTALNPKGIAFFVAFLPQFVQPETETAPQLLLLGATFLLLAGINTALYAVFAGQLRDRMTRPRVRRWFHRCGGCALVCAGMITAALRRG